MQRECRLRVLKPGARFDDSGAETLNMSSSGILICADRNFEAGTLLEIAIQWPVQINEQCRLKMVVRARVVRSEPGRTAVVIQRYEFRTAGLSRFKH